MPSHSYWITRFTIVGASALVSLASIIIISTSGILESLPMKYILAIAICQLVMACIAVVFGICSLQFDLSSFIDSQNQLMPDHTTALVLMTAEGILFKLSELISFFLIAVLTLVIHQALKRRAKTPHEYRINFIGIGISVTLVGLFAGLGGLGFCYSDDNYFNFVCINMDKKVIYWLLWAGPCILLALATFAMTLHIAIKRYQKDFYNSLPVDFKLVLRIYWIPFCGFIIYLVDLALTTHHFDDSATVGITILNNVLFFMPVVMLITVIVYRKRYLALIELSFHASPSTQNPSQIQRQQVNDTGSIDSKGLLMHH